MATSDLDQDVRRAIDIMARAIGYNVLQKETNDSYLWGDYPDIGERDWQRIAEEASLLVDGPGLSQYEWAYELLKARATDEA